MGKHLGFVFSSKSVCFFFRQNDVFCAPAEEFCSSGFEGSCCVLEDSALFFGVILEGGITIQKLI